MGKRKRKRRDWKPPITKWEQEFAAVLRWYGIPHKQGWGMAGYWVDFWIPEAETVVEIDGQHHRKKRLQDQRRTRRLRKKAGVKHIYRLWNSEVGADNPRALWVIKQIQRHLMRDLIDFCFVEGE